jgi:small subunit ribosomal protein S21
VQVFVRDNNVDQALKALKRKLQREGVFREMKLRKHYEKPSEKKVRERAEAVRTARKLARKKLQREGLLPPTKPRVERAAGGRAGPSLVPRFGSWWGTREKALKSGAQRKMKLVPPKERDTEDKGGPEASPEVKARRSGLPMLPYKSWSAARTKAAMLLATRLTRCCLVMISGLGRLKAFGES